MRKVFLSAATLLSITTIQAQDWRTDDVVAVTYTNAVKIELLKHLTLDGQAVVRVTNLQSCNTDISIHCANGYTIKNFDAGETDTANFTLTFSDDGAGFIYAVPWVNCDGNAETEMYSAFFYPSWLEPAIVEQVVIDSSLGINVRLANHRKRNVTKWLTGIPIIVRLGVPNRTQKTN